MSVSILNRAKTRRFILDMFEHERPGMGITRVSEKSLNILENALRERIRLEVMRHPSVGKTFNIANLL